MDWDSVDTIATSDLHKADIILVDGGATFASTAIEMGTSSPVSHVAMCLDYDEVVESLNNGPTTNKDANYGPKTDSIEKWCDQLRHALVLRHKSFDTSGPQDRVCSWARHYVNRSSYDWATIAELSLRTTPVMAATGGSSYAKYLGDRAAFAAVKKVHGYPRAQDDSFICSEFVVRMYLKSGYRIIDDACWVAPADFISVSLWSGKPSTTDSKLYIVGKLK
jgi:hypothetical protein